MSGSNTCSLICRNTSDEAVYFYLYQKMADQPSDMVSLVWLISPRKLAKNSYFKFSWSRTYIFVWRGTGLVQPGAVFYMGGWQAANLKEANFTEFKVTDDTPDLTAPTRKPKRQFRIKTSGNVPDNMYAVGIGMAGAETEEDNFGYAAFLRQARPDKEQNFTPKSTYWVASGSVKKGEVLPRKVKDPATEVIFPPHVYDMTATYRGKDKMWEIKPALSEDLEGFIQIF